MLSRDERRFKKADSDSDGKMTLQEFSAFLHPENHNEMKMLVVEETLEDIDKDKDGFISLEEYIGKSFYFCFDWFLFIFIRVTAPRLLSKCSYLFLF